ncbi:diguanylate cyclase [Vibrio mimicus]
MIYFDSTKDNSIKLYDEKAKIDALDRAFGIVEFDTQGNIVTLNDNFLNLFGYTKEELIGFHHCKLLNKNDQSKHDIFWSRVLRGEIMSGEFRRINKFGMDVWINASYTQIKDNKGAVIGILKLAVDTTEKRNKEAYNKSRIDAIYRSQSVIEFDLDGHISYVNTNYCKLSGYNPKQITGEHHSVLCPSEFTESPDYAMFWNRLRNGEIISGKFERIGLGGRHFWIQASYNPIYDSDGKIFKITKYAYDISENIKMEKSLKMQHDISSIIANAQQNFLLNRNLPHACDQILDPILHLTDSEFGFIGIIQKQQDEVLLYIPSITNLSWNKDTKQWYENQKSTNNGLLFRNFDNLFGQVIKENVIVCTNDPESHSASKGTPPGHPKIKSFLGIPIRTNDTITGMIAIANRADGYHQDIIDALMPLVAMMGSLIHARKLEDERNIIEETLRFNAEHDFLTGLPNRNSFFQHTDKIFHSFNIASHPLNNNCLAIIDIDHFKKINDTYGHMAGDSILKQFSELLSKQFRDIDIFARIGGEEFIVLLKATSLPLSLKIIERCREIVENHIFKFDDAIIKVTFSAGVSQFSTAFKNVDEWARDADEKLYESKRKGRNNVS